MGWSLSLFLISLLIDMEIITQGSCLNGQNGKKKNQEEVGLHLEGRTTTFFHLFIVCPPTKSLLDFWLPSHTWPPGLNALRK